MFRNAAAVAKLVDALGLGPSGATLESSSLSGRTNKTIPKDCFLLH